MRQIYLGHQITQAVDIKHEITIKCIKLSSYIQAERFLDIRQLPYVPKITCV